MNKDDILKFINENPEFFLATCEENEPRVRAMCLYQADDEGIFFNTSKDKSLYRQLAKNPSVEMCFYDGERIQVRIRGKAQLTVEEGYKEQMCLKTPQMRPFIMDGGIVVFRLTEARAKVWKMSSDHIPRLMSNFELDSLWMSMYMGNEQ
ncbi:MAG: pyridoxamine 5'-phosphate oxidase family protein [Phycisphaerae bacterium]|nr:pyridoxamine 5'-phosphate oxidase family protein [Phycisphaerae bacterium]